MDGGALCCEGGLGLFPRGMTSLPAHQPVGDKAFNQRQTRTGCSEFWWVGFGIHTCDMQANILVECK
jgi:hypothetical protein